MWEVCKRRSSNAIVNKFSELLKDERAVFDRTSLNEIRDLDKPARQFLDGLTHIRNGRINGPEDVYVIAQTFKHSPELRKLSTADKWSVAIAINLEGTLVVEGNDMKANRLRTGAKKQKLEVLTFEEFLSEEIEEEEVEE